MKFLNKITSLATVVALCVTFATTAFAADITISLSSDKTTFAPGETFDVKVNIDSHPGFIVGQLCAGVPDGLTLIGATSSNVYGAGSFSTNYKDGYVFMIGDEGAEADYTTTGHAATLTYKISDTASGSYTIDVYQYPEDCFYDFDFDELYLDPATLTITVTGGDGPTVEKAEENTNAGITAYTVSTLANQKVMTKTFTNVDVKPGMGLIVTKGGVTREFGGDLYEKLGGSGGQTKIGSLTFGLIVEGTATAADFTFELR